MPNYCQLSLLPFLSDTRKERWTMIVEGLFSGLEAQSEITDQLKQALEAFREALESHHRSLERLESELIEFEEILNLPQRRPHHPQAKEQGVGAGRPNLLSITEVCRELGMSRSWVHRRIKSGEIPAVKLGGKKKVRREDLEGYLEANSSDP